MNLSFFTSSLMQFQLLGQEDAAASTDAIFNMVGNTIYTLLAVVALWGAFCILMVWRRVAAKRFKNEKAQDLFLGHHFHRVEQEVDAGDANRLPGLDG